jgi:hypothetical protein
MGPKHNLFYPRLYTMALLVPLSIGLTCRVSTPHHIWACGPHRMWEGWDWKLKYHIFLSVNNMYNNKGLKNVFLHKRYFTNVKIHALDSKVRWDGGGWHQTLQIKCRDFAFFLTYLGISTFTGFPLYVL